MTRARLIVNPASGRERATQYAWAICERLRDRYDAVEMVLTTGDGDAERAAIQAVADGCGAVIVAGGDGTLNEALNGIHAAAALDRTTLGLIPLGTGNDFATALDIPSEIEEAIRILTAGKTLRVDIGKVNGRVFLNTSGGGFIAEVSVAVTPQLKTIAGRLAYLVGGAHALLDYEPVRATIATEPDGLRLGLGLYAFAVCNSRLIGGGRLIAPAASIDDGLLDVCLIEAMSSFDFIALARKVAAGDHVNDPRVRYVQASSIRIEFDREIRINTDGEVFPATVCEYSILPRAATFVAGAAPFTTATSG
jgi:diacylglycerol kinase (ATP)